MSLGTNGQSAEYMIRVRSAISREQLGPSFGESRSALGPTTESTCTVMALSPIARSRFGPTSAFEIHVAAVTQIAQQFDYNTVVTT